MPGRNAKPIALHLVQGNPNHLTQKEIERRKKSEIKIGTQKWTCPKYVKTDKIAYEKWREIMKIYKGIDFVSTADIGILGRYCKTYSEYRELLARRAAFEKNMYLSDAELEEVRQIAETELTENQTRALMAKLDYILSTTGILALDRGIDKKIDTLIKMEDRIFLNPLARVKSVPRAAPEQPEDELSRKGFGDV